MKRRLLAIPPARRVLLLSLLAGLLGGFVLFVVVQRSRQTHYKGEYLPSVVYYHRVKKGMTQDEVENSCGRPEYAQQMNNLGDEAESWFYTASDGAVQVVFDEGKVRNINRQ